jgi:hypothetical protein
MTMNTPYKMLPIERQPGAYVIKPRPKVPKIAPNAAKVPYRILAISEDCKTATICANMQMLSGGQLSVVDVDITMLGYKSVSVGDVLAYSATDAQYARPMIIHRYHQSHQFPKQLLANDEV